MPDNIESAKYSLWIEPPAFVALRFNALIEALSSQHNGFKFTSHITLLGNLTGEPAMLIEKARALAESSKAFDVKLDGLGHGKSMYQALYLRAVGEGLFKCREDAERLFAPNMGEAPNTAFNPHLSIFYGTLTPEARDTIITSMGGALGATFKAEGITLYKTSGQPAYWRQTGKQIFFA
jgi:2'-5' RNA ligase